METGIKRVLFVGAGRAGSILAAEIAKASGATAVCIDTSDDIDAVELPATQRLKLVTDVRPEMDMQAGEIIASENQENIEKFVAPRLGDRDIAVICASGGGSFGGGSLLVLVESLQKLLAGVSPSGNRVGVALGVVRERLLSPIEKKRWELSKFIHETLKTEYMDKGRINSLLTFSTGEDLKLIPSKIVDVYGGLFGLDSLDFDGWPSQPKDMSSRPVTRLSSIIPRDAPTEQDARAAEAPRRNVYGG